VDFKIISNFKGQKFFKLEKERIYDVLPRTTHIHVYNGFISFGASKSKDTNWIKKTNRGKFIKIPSGASSIQFPRYLYVPAGHNYGQVVFNPEPPDDAA